jgi:two-component system, chemotaxis family, protein-glutamate methylesterase/glutaminase
MISRGQNMLRVLVVDDSALNRKQVRELLVGTGEVQVVGEAADGQDALTQVFQLKPDAITLDLEMPRMNGFTFLRLLMARQPTPVIVISRHSEKENVFKALEFGAIDFLEKPLKWSDADREAMAPQLLEKVLLLRTLRAERGALRHAEVPRSVRSRPPSEPSRGSRGVPRRVVAIASSAGGPAALLEIFSQLPERAPIAVLVAQHMPPRFTATFAQRLEYRSRLTVAEARDGEVIAAHHGYVCPGDRCMELELDDDDGETMRLRVVPPRAVDRYVPSADRLLQSVARVVGPRAVGVVLTGMGDDGARGASAIRRNRGTVIVESRETAVVPGMPTAAAPSADQVLALGEIAKFLSQLT